MSLFWAFHFCTLHSICFFQAGIWTSVVNLLAQDVVLLAEVWAKFARTFSSASPLILFFSRIDASLSDPASLPNWYCEQEHRLVTPFDTCAIRIETLSSAIGSLSYTTWSAKDSPSSAIGLPLPPYRLSSANVGSNFPSPTHLSQANVTSLSKCTCKCQVFFWLCHPRCDYSNRLTLHCLTESSF